MRKYFCIVFSGYYCQKTAGKGFKFGPGATKCTEIPLWQGGPSRGHHAVTGLHWLTGKLVCTKTPTRARETLAEACAIHQRIRLDKGHLTYIVAMVRIQLNFLLSAPEADNHGNTFYHRELTWPTLHRTPSSPMLVAVRAWKPPFPQPIPVKAWCWTYSVHYLD